VPSRCCHDGGCSDVDPSSVGTLEANQGANVDNSEITTRMISPIPPKRVPNRRRSRSSGADARDCFKGCGTDISTLGSAGIDVLPERP